jgi:hypothetical protein
MLTHRTKRRRNLRQEASRAGGQVAAKAQGALSGAAGAATAARTEVGKVGKLPHQVRDQADRTVSGARRAAASRMFGTAARLSNAAEVVEHGRGSRRRRWPLVAGVAALLAAIGVVVTKLARGLRGQGSESPDAETTERSEDPGDQRQADRSGEGNGKRSTRPEAGDVNRHTEPAAASSTSGNRNRNDAHG